MKTWYRRPTRCFALLSGLGFLIVAAWASTVASEDERFIPPLALGGAMILVWRFGFSPCVRQTPTEVLIEQPWCTWHVPLSRVDGVGVAGGALSITTAGREIVAFGLSSSLLLSIFGDRLLSRAVDELQQAVVAAPGRQRSDRVRATGWRLLAEAVGIPVVSSAVAGLVRLW